MQVSFVLYFLQTELQRPKFRSRPKAVAQEQGKAAAREQGKPAAARAGEGSGAGAGEVVGSQINKKVNKEKLEALFANLVEICKLLPCHINADSGTPRAVIVLIGLNSTISAHCNEISQ
jgi:hypothetical protein